MTTQKASRRSPEGPIFTRLEWILIAALSVMAIVVAVLLVREIRQYATTGGDPEGIPTAVAEATLPSETPTTSGDPTAVPTQPSTAEPTITETPGATAVVPTTTASHTPTPTCTYDMRFVTDVTVPDDTVMLPGTAFVKTWRVRNSGTCAWEAGATWFFTGGAQMNGPNAVAVPATAVGQTADISVNLIAPTTPGSYTGTWALRLPHGQIIDKQYYVRITVANPTPTRAPATATPTIYNWRGDYYNNTGFVGTPALVRDDTAVQFNWGSGSPATAVNADNFSVVWRRNLTFDGATYRFFVFADDGVRVWIDNTLIIDQWHNYTGVTYQADIPLSAGSHAVRVEYYENGGQAQIQFWWERATTYTDWRGEYWNNRSFSGPPTLIRNDAAVNFNWGRGAPAAGIPADDFTARWTRTLNFAEGSYRFRLRMDDGARLYVDNNLIIDEWRDGSQREVSKDLWLAGGNHTVRVDYYEKGGEASVRLLWDQISGYPEWRGEYWSNQTLSGSPTLTRNDASINFNWGFDAPAGRLPSDNFSARWTRQIDFSAGTYRLYAKSDDGVRVYVDGQRVLDQWHDNSADRKYSTDVVLTGKHTLIVEYYDNQYSAQIQFWYERIGGLPTATPKPTNTPLPTPTSTATPIPTIPTATPQPTNTPLPTSTPPPLPTSTPTNTPQPTSTPLPTAVPASLIRINELLAVPGTTDWNGDDSVDAGDGWIEVANLGPTAVDISGWRLRIANVEGAVYIFPAGTELAGGDLLLLFADTTTLLLPDEGGRLLLRDANAETIHSVDWPALPADASYSRDAGDGWHSDWPPSPGKPNAANGPA